MCGRRGAQARETPRSSPGTEGLLLRRRRRRLRRPEWDRTYEAMDANQLMAVFLKTPDEGLNPNQLTALVRNLKAKKGKGKGKGKPRVCYECDSESHIARDCPVRAARVAAGGPERPPKNSDVEMSNSSDKGGKGRNAKDEGKVGKGGKGCPPMAAWKTYNIVPCVIRPSQWGQWDSSQTQLQQLKSHVAD